MADDQLLVSGEEGEQAVEIPLPVIVTPAVDDDTSGAFQTAVGLTGDEAVEQAASDRRRATSSPLVKGQSEEAGGEAANGPLALGDHDEAGCGEIRIRIGELAQLGQE